MYRIIITAGGTREAIDDVRAITNGSTGTLGSKIAEEFLDSHYEEIEEIVYIHGVGAKLPGITEKVKFVRVEGGMDLLKALEKEMRKKQTHIVVHSMAVSDYRVDRVMKKDRENFTEIDTRKKISSEIPELAVILKKNPKVIKHIKAFDPDTILVGFKLLSHVDKEELFSVAMALMEKNNCDFVLANDLREITAESHVGYLIDSEGTALKYDTKEEIAKGISDSCMDLLKKRSN